MTSLNELREHVSSNFANVSLKVKASEDLKSYNLFVERVPFWSSPFPNNTIADFKVGARVMNLNSS